jgi:glycosyltransferase involved in cell wall biosynthesis
MDISVIICTYNRATSLQRTLSTCCELAIPSEISWELLVVDNNSTDGTEALCKTFHGKLPIRHIFERNQGQSFARNRGVTEARGELVLFTDDDVDVDSNWLKAFHDGMMANPDVSFSGGRVLVRWSQPPPKWVKENIRDGKTDIHFDLGDTLAFVSAGDDSIRFLGANMGFRRSVFAPGVSFPTALSAKGDDRFVMQVLGEEVHLQAQLLASGHKGLYVPDCIVHHRTPAYRHTEAYYRRRVAGYGAAAARMGAFKGSRTLLRAPRYMWRRVAIGALRYILTRYTCPSRIWLKAESEMAYTWGVILVSRRRG